MSQNDFHIPQYVKISSIKTLVMRAAKNSKGVESKTQGNVPHSTACLWLPVTRILAEREEECRLGFWHLLGRKKELRLEKCL